MLTIFKKRDHMRNVSTKLSILLIVFLFIFVACSNDDSSEQTEATDNQSTDEEQGNGGTLDIAINAQPPTLDQPITNASSTRDVSRLMFEGLVTTNSDFEPTPMLAESIDISDDFKTYSFNLRQGVKFHNGEEMIAEDVLASMERWTEHATIAGTVNVDLEWTSEDDYTVVLNTSDAAPLILDSMSSAKYGAAIMPKDVVEEATEDGVQDYIGTGPYKFDEWVTDQYISFTK